MYSLIAAMIIWGSLGVFALWSKLDASDLAFTRCVIGGVILFFYCLHSGEFNKKSLNPKNVFFALVSGIFIVFNWVLLFKSFQLASITIGNVSYYLQPVFLIILGVLFLKEQVSLAQWGFILLTTYGVILTSDLHLSQIDGSNYLFLGMFAAIGAGLLYSFATLIIKFVDGLSPSLLTLIQLTLGAGILLPSIDLNHFYHLSQDVWMNVLLIGIIHTALAYILYYHSLKKVNITLIAIISYLDPIVAILSDVVFFNRHLGMLQYLGILLTFIGSYFVITLKTKAKNLDLKRSILEV